MPSSVKSVHQFSAITDIFSMKTISKNVRGEFMKGIELSEKFYLEFGAPMLHQNFSGIENLIAVGLVGSGSECFGYDDDISKDHDYEPGFCVFVPDEDIIDETNFRSVFFEAFSDTPKITLAQIVGIPANWTYNDWKKDSVIIDLYDFSYIQAKDKFDLHCLESEVHPWSAKQLKEFVDTGRVNINKNHVYITLRELITYYSKYVMQGYFGQSIWVKSLENCKWETERFYTGRGNTIYKIFTDCKFPTEISYIKNNEGIIVKVNRYSNTKENTDIS